MPMNDRARSYLDNQFRYVPRLQDPLEDYAYRQKRLDDELKKVGIQDPNERNQIRLEYLGREPMEEAGLGDQLLRTTARGALGLVENVGSVGEYLGNVTGAGFLEEPMGALASGFRGVKERMDPAYDPEDPGFGGYMQMALESGIASAPAMLAPMGGARLGYLGARGLAETALGGRALAGLGRATGLTAEKALERSLYGGAIAGGTVGGAVSNAGLEGGTTFSQTKQELMQQGIPEAAADQEARRRANEVAIANLGGDPELFAYNVLQGVSGPAGKLIGGPIRQTLAQSGLEAMQEGRQYEVGQRAAGEPNTYGSRFTDPEGRTSMIVGALSQGMTEGLTQGVGAASEYMNRVDDRVDPVATDLQRRAKDAAYGEVQADGMRAEQEQVQAELKRQRQEEVQAARDELRLQEQMMRSEATRKKMMLEEMKMRVEAQRLERELAGQENPQQQQEMQSLAQQKRADSLYLKDNAARLKELYTEGQDLQKQAVQAEQSGADLTPLRNRAEEIRQEIIAIENDNIQRVGRQAIDPLADLPNQADPARSQAMRRTATEEALQGVLQERNFEMPTGPERRFPTEPTPREPKQYGPSRQTNLGEILDREEELASMYEQGPQGMRLGRVGAQERIAADEMARFRTDVLEEAVGKVLSQFPDEMTRFPLYGGEKTGPKRMQKEIAAAIREELLRQAPVDVERQELRKQAQDEALATTLARPQEAAVTTPSKTPVTPPPRRGGNVDLGEILDVEEDLAAMRERGPQGVALGRTGFPKQETRRLMRRDAVEDAVVKVLSQLPDEMKPGFTLYGGEKTGPKRMQKEIAAAIREELLRQAPVDAGRRGLRQDAKTEALANTLGRPQAATLTSPRNPSVTALPRRTNADLGEMVDIEENLAAMRGQGPQGLGVGKTGATLDGRAADPQMMSEVPTTEATPDSRTQRLNEERQRLEAMRQQKQQPQEEVLPTTIEPVAPEPAALAEQPAMTEEPQAAAEPKPYVRPSDREWREAMTQQQIKLLKKYAKQLKIDPEATDGDLIDETTIFYGYARKKIKELYNKGDKRSLDKALDIAADYEAVAWEDTDDADYASEAIDDIVGKLKKLEEATPEVSNPEPVAKPKVAPESKPAAAPSALDEKTRKRQPKINIIKKYAEQLKIDPESIAANFAASDKKFYEFGRKKIKELYEKGGTDNLSEALKIAHDYEKYAQDARRERMYIEKQIEEIDAKLNEIYRSAVAGADARGYFLEEFAGEDSPLDTETASIAFDEMYRQGLIEILEDGDYTFKEESMANPQIIEMFASLEKERRKTAENKAARDRGEGKGHGGARKSEAPPITVDPLPPLGQITAEDLTSSVKRQLEEYQAALDELPDEFLDSLNATQEKNFLKPYNSLESAYKKAVTGAKSKWNSSVESGQFSPTKLISRAEKLFTNNNVEKDELRYYQILQQLAEQELQRGDRDIIRGVKNEGSASSYLGDMDSGEGGGIYSGYGESTGGGRDAQDDFTMDESGDVGGLRFSYSSRQEDTAQEEGQGEQAPPVALTARQVRAAVTGIKSVLNKLDPTGEKVLVFENKEEAAAFLESRGYARDAAATRRNNDQLEEAATLPDGTIYLIADQLQGTSLRGAVDRATEVVFHEALGHQGLKGLLGDKFDSFVDNFAKRNTPAIRRWLQTKEGAPYSEFGTRVQAEEYIARNFAEKGIQQETFLGGIVRSVLDALRLRQYSESAVRRAMLKVADNYAEAGGDILGGVDGIQTLEPAAEPEVKEPVTQKYRITKPPKNVTPQKYRDFLQAAVHDYGPGTQTNASYDAIQDAVRSFVNSKRKDRDRILTEEGLSSVGERLMGEQLLQQPLEVAENGKKRELLPEPPPLEEKPATAAAKAKDSGVRKSLLRSRQNIQGGTPASSFQLEESSLLEDARYYTQDKMIDVKRVVEAYKKKNSGAPNALNAYLRETLYHGRAAKKTTDFLVKELQPLTDRMRALGVSTEQFEEYLKNRHAEERNRQIAKINPSYPDGGSGIKTADARRYLSGLPAQQRKSFQQLAGVVDLMVEQTQQMLVDSGLETQETIDNWRKAYKYYVPMQRENLDFTIQFGSQGTGRGFSTGGDFSRRATGSSKEVVNVLANIAMQRERAIVRAEKNRVAQSVYRLALKLPSSDFWLAVDPQGQKNPKAALDMLAGLGLSSQDIQAIMKEPTVARTDPKTGVVSYQINPLARNNPNVMSVRINGEDKFLFFNANNARAKRMAESLQNLDLDSTENFLLRGSGVVTRWISQVNTQYNPIFSLFNFARDLQGGMINLSSTELAGKQKEVLNNVAPALKGIWQSLRSADQGQSQPNNPWSSLWEEFQNQGGQTGYRNQYSMAEDRAKAIQKMLHPESWADNGLGKIFTADGRLKVPMEVARKKGKGFFDFISSANETIENGIRLAAYKTARDNGMSKEEAAYLAKELTVNFNRKGKIGREAGALYSFFNASVQGSARMLETLTKGRNPNAPKSSPDFYLGAFGQKFVAGAMLAGLMQEILLRAAGMDDEEPPEFVKERNFVLPILGTDSYLTFPLALGYNLFPTLGRTAASILFDGGEDADKKMARFTGQIIDSFNPIGGAGWSMQTIAPTVLDPFAALIENQDWTGKPIYREDMTSTRPTPGHTRVMGEATTFSAGLAYGLNWITGGTDYKPGVLSPTPDMFDYLIGYATGGAGRELQKIEQLGTSFFTGEELPPYQTPLVGRLYGNTTSGASESARFYSNVTALNEHQAEIEGRRRNREDVRGYLQENPEARLYSLGDKAALDVQKLQKRKREMKERGASAASIRLMDEQIKRRMKRLNDRIREASD